MSVTHTSGPITSGPIKSELPSQVFEGLRAALPMALNCIAWLQDRLQAILSCPRN